MLTEIKSMPSKAMEFLENTAPYTLPTGVPYLGMGSSYFAPLCFKYMGHSIFPELASEFFNYLKPAKKIDNGVLLSQSGKSTEVLWCANLFKKFTAISNYADSPLCQKPAADQVVKLLAGEEKFSSSKTYINTLLALFKGLGVDVHKTTSAIAQHEAQYDSIGKEFAMRIFSLLESGNLNGLYITGSGPNIGTAMQAALILSESTKLNFNGMPMAQYDHGPKETADRSVVINIQARGQSYDRTLHLASKIKNAGAHVFTVEAPGIQENDSVLHNIIPFNYLAYYLSQQMHITDTFIVGGKVTEV